MHSQADRLNFTMYALGERFIIDTGYGLVPIKGSSEVRRLGKLGESHNQVMIDGEASSASPTLRAEVSSSGRSTTTGSGSSEKLPVHTPPQGVSKELSQYDSTGRKSLSSSSTLSFLLQVCISFHGYFTLMPQIDSGFGRNGSNWKVVEAGGVFGYFSVQTCTST